MELDSNNIEYWNFLNLFTEILIKHAPLKKNTLRANQGKFVTKDIHKAMIIVLDFEVGFCALKQKLRGKNTNNNETFVVISCQDCLTIRNNFLEIIV